MLNPKECLKNQLKKHNNRQQKRKLAQAADCEISLNWKGDQTGNLRRQEACSAKKLKRFPQNNKKLLPNTIIEAYALKVNIMWLWFPGNAEDKYNNACFSCNLFHISCVCLYNSMFICGCHPQSNRVRHSIFNRNASYLWRTGRLVEQKRVAGKTKGCCGPRQLRTQTPEGSPAPKSRLPAWSLYPKTHKRFIRSCVGREEGGEDPLTQPWLRFHISIYLSFYWMKKMGIGNRDRW